ncbi:MAG: ribbon-helix-helix protein, CopG family [Vicinamibacterales bacterium]
MSLAVSRATGLSLIGLTRFSNAVSAEGPSAEFRRMMTCYDDALRTIIDLPEDQLQALDGICRRDDISRAEAIRQAVALLVRQRGRPDPANTPHTLA